VLEPILPVIVAPVLVGASTLAARRWGPWVGGLVSAFPAIVGPVLLIVALEQGTTSAAQAATGTLLGLVALSGFALAYGRTAPRAGWRACLLAGWAAAAVIALVVGAAGGGVLAASVAATVSLVVAHRALPPGAGRPAIAAVPRWDLPVRMAATVVLVLSLAAAASRLGPVVGGILAALPVLASVLAAFTHVGQGAAALADLLRGMLGGMAGFVVFCALVAVLVDRAGVATAFATAAVAAIAAQAAVVRAGADGHAPA
jgi:hypothetical protein